MDEVIIESVVGLGTKITMKKKIKKEDEEKIEKIEKLEIKENSINEIFMS